LKYRNSCCVTNPLCDNTTGGLTGPTGKPGPTGQRGQDGAQGPTGLRGADGTASNTGAQGPTGPRGIDGQSFTGHTGPRGASGDQGPTGVRGADGSTGVTGSSGADGVTGATGLRGPDGPTGSTGLRGPDGPTGSTGMRGADGVTGATGMRGPDGPTGSTGLRGADGPTGSTGLRGPDGPTGSTGLRGPDGPTGSTGMRGADGVTGATGMRGADGQSFTGDTGPRGVDGVTGATGMRGADGQSFTGHTGPRGADGVTGATGIRGADGPTGSTGMRGADGPTGVTGSSGADGVTGATGMRGADGPTGSTGSRGVDGQSFTGHTGPTGEGGVTGPTGERGESVTGPTGQKGLDGSSTLTGATGPMGPTGFTGPQGIDGSATATGATGPTGQMGPTGVQGKYIEGATGPTGLPGSATNTGATGPLGPEGPTGPEGAPGTSSNTGATGPTGPIYVFRPTYDYYVSPNGQDSPTNGSEQSPFQTLEYAIIQRQSSPFGSLTMTIHLSSGAYYPSTALTIPPFTTIKGTSTASTKIFFVIATVSPLIGITMSSNTRVEDVNINISQSLAEQIIVGVLFPDDRSTDAKLRGVIINVTSTDTSTSDIVGVYASGNQSGNLFETTSFDTMQQCTVKVNSVSTGRIAALATFGKVKFQVRDSVFYSIGQTPSNTVYGAAVFRDTTGYGFISLKSCTVSGSSYDVAQPILTSSDEAAILLNETDLRNATSLRGFSVSTEPSHFFFSLGSSVSFNGGGSEIATSPGTYYLHSGTQIANFSTGIVGITFAQKIIVIEGITFCSTNITDSTVVTVDFLFSTDKSVEGDSFATLTLNATNNLARIKNIAKSFDATTHFLQVRCVISGGSLVAGNDVMVSVGVY
jgi:hypothetical protein